MGHKVKMKAWDSEWENIHKEEKWHHYPSEHLIRFIAKHFYNVPDRRKIKILEIGCGAGSQIWYLAKENFDVYGIDGSPTAIILAEKRLKSEKLEAVLEVGDVININYPDEYFDCVVDVECLMAINWDNSKEIIRKVRRLLKTGGLFYSQTFTDNTTIGKNVINVGKNTFKGIEANKDNVTAEFLGRKRLIRVLPEEDIPKLYSDFSKYFYDKATITRENRSYIYEEWIIECEK